MRPTTTLPAEVLRSRRVANSIDALPADSETLTVPSGPSA
jgi:hypothetical protein